MTSIKDDPIKYAEYIRKQRESHLGKKASPETRKILSESHKGIKQTPEWISKRIAAAIASPNRGAKISLARKGKPGKIPSPETRLKMSIAGKGKKKPPFSEEHCKNISLGKKGKPSWNKGHKDLQKLSLSQIRIWFYKLPMRKVKRKTPVLSQDVLQKKIELCKNRVWKEESLMKISLSKIGKPRPEHVRHALIKASIGRIISDKTRRKMSIASTGRRWSEERRLEFQEIRKNWTIPYQDSKPEKMMQIALALNGIKFEKHKSFKLGRKWHKVDIFIEPNICVEVDGVNWHIPIDRIKGDLFQSQELTIMGYHVIRIRDKDILKNTQNCAEKVIQLIKELQYRHVPLG